MGKRLDELSKVDLADEIVKRDAEIERLRDKYDKLYKLLLSNSETIGKDKAEIERLQAVVDAAGEYLYDTSKRDVLQAAYLAVSENNHE